MSTPRTTRNSPTQSPNKTAGSRKTIIEDLPAQGASSRKTPGARAQRARAQASLQNSDPTAMAAVEVSIDPGWIAQAAYFRAEKRGFTPGCELDDWLAAEAEVIAHQLEREPVRGAS